MSGTQVGVQPRSSAYAKFLAIDRTIYMTMGEAQALSRDLADVIRAAIRPDLLVGVANGALLPMKIAADELNVPFRVVHLRRRGSRLKRRLFAVKEALGIPTAFLITPPMRALQTAFEQRTKTLEETDGAFDFDVSGKTVVVVDDSIQTGGTARHVKERIMRKGAARVLIAVICWYKGVNDSGDWSPDLYLHRRYQWYPWSNNSPYFNEYLAWLAENGLQYWR